MGNSVKRTYKKNQKKKAIKKDLQTILMVSFISVLVVIVIGLILLFFFKKNNIGKVTYPANPLTQTVNSHYSYIENTEMLPNKIQMPTEPVIVSVGGSERYVPYNGRVYLYASDLYLSIYELYGTTYDLYSTQFVSDLYGGNFGSVWTYEVANSYTGYFNGYRAEYQCGECAIYDSLMNVQKSIYLISLTIDMGLDKQINITTSTSNKKLLYNAETLLETVGYTLMDVSKTSYTNEDATYLLDGTSDSMGEAYIGAPIVASETTISEMPFQTASAVTLESTDFVDSAAPEASWNEYYIDISDFDSVGERVVILSFDNTNANIKEGILSSPDKTLSINYTSKENDKLLFDVTNPVTGKWVVRVNSENTIGTYQGYCVDKGVYMMCNQDLEKTLAYKTETESGESSIDAEQSVVSTVVKDGPPTEIITNEPIKD